VKSVNFKMGTGMTTRWEQLPGWEVYAFSDGSFHLRRRALSIVVANSGDEFRARFRAKGYELPTGGARPHEVAARAALDTALEHLTGWRQDVEERVLAMVGPGAHC